ncbi:MAG: hypothetical protein JW753_09595 [Dehalococcoidia bacterium]|nr:hypothetical protein [Dehalococcoidia bacterium]
MADIAKAMLANGLDDVFPCPTEVKALKRLSEALNANAEAASDVYRNPDLECFGWHLDGENCKIQAMGVSKAHDDIPYEVIETLRIVARRKTFKGTCSVCRDW